MFLIWFASITHHSNFLLTFRQQNQGFSKYCESKGKVIKIQNRVNLWIWNHIPLLKTDVAFFIITQRCKNGITMVHVLAFTETEITFSEK